MNNLKFFSVVVLFFVLISFSNGLKAQEDIDRLNCDFYVLMDDETINPYTRISDYGIRVGVKDEYNNYSSIYIRVSISIMGTAFYREEHSWNGMVEFLGLQRDLYVVDILQADLYDGYVMSPFCEWDYTLEIYSDGTDTRVRKVYVITFSQIFPIFKNQYNSQSIHYNNTNLNPFDNNVK